MPGPFSFDKTPGDVQVLWVSLEESPGAVGTVGKELLMVIFLNGTHSTWRFPRRNPQHLDVTWSFIGRDGYRLAFALRGRTPAR